MKSILVLFCLFSSSLFAISGQWNYGAVVTNPTTSTVFTSAVMPTSGSTATPPSADYLVGAFLYCSINETYEIQVLNGSKVVQATVPIPCSATQPSIVPPGTISFPIQDGWTVQIVPAVTFVGFGSAQLFYAMESVN